MILCYSSTIFGPGTSTLYYRSMDAAYVLEKRWGTKIMHIFLKEGGRKIRRKRKIKLLKHTIALYICIVFLSLSKMFSLAMFARLHFILQSEMPACNVTTSDGRNSKANSLRTLVIFSYIFDVIIPDS